PYILKNNYLVIFQLFITKNYLFFLFSNFLLWNFSIKPRSENNLRTVSDGFAPSCIHFKSSSSSISTSFGSAIGLYVPIDSIMRPEIGARESATRSEERRVGKSSECRCDDDE